MFFPKYYFFNIVESGNTLSMIALLMLKMFEFLSSLGRIQQKIINVFLENV